MISRQCRGLAKAECAEACIEHLRTETFPVIAKISGFLGAAILHRPVPDGIEVLVVTEWASLDAIRAFAGKNAEQAVVPPQVHNTMVDYDRVVRHYEVVQ